MALISVHRTFHGSALPKGNKGPSSSGQHTSYLGLVHCSSRPCLSVFLGSWRTPPSLYEILMDRPRN